MIDYSQYKQCRNCGKYDQPDDVCSFGGRYDYSMYCDGVLTWGVDPFAEEIHGDSTEYLDCYGNRYESAMDI